MRIDNFISNIESSLLENWDSTAVIEYNKDRKVSYCELANSICRYHAVWKQYGLSKGDRIAINCGNSIEWVELFLAIISGGYVACLLPNNLTMNEVSQYSRHSGSRLLYTSMEVNNDSVDCAEAVIDPHSNKFAFANDRLEKCISDAKTLVFDKTEIKWEPLDRMGLEAIVYTSGSTSEPKAVMHTINFVGSSLNTVLSTYLYKKGDYEVCLMPFFHVFGVAADLVASLCSGMTLIVIPDITPMNIFNAIKTYKPRHLFAPPFLLTKIIENNEAMYTDLNGKSSYDEKTYSKMKDTLINMLGGNLEVFTTGGAALTGSLESWLINKLHFPLVTLYGSTEGGLISVNTPDRYVIGSAGRVVDLENTRISEQNGEIQIKGEIFAGYFNNPKATAAAFTEDGWFRTGDLGHIDENGNLFITGRCKDMLLTSNGENIYPEEIESEMDASPYIKESILVQKDEKLFAIVVPNREMAESDGLDEDTLRKKIDDAVRDAGKKIPGFAIISDFEIRDEPLERTPKGNLKRFLYS